MTETDWLADSPTPEQAGGTLISPWPSTSAKTAEAVGFVPTDPWPGGWSVKTAALRREADLRGPHRAGHSSNAKRWLVILIAVIVLVVVTS